MWFYTISCIFGPIAHTYLRTYRYIVASRMSRNIPLHFKLPTPCFFLYENHCQLTNLIWSTECMIA